ncbi:hypothetical protein JCM8547_003525 [Rhodosporidiobolus lusitaniae]
MPGKHPKVATKKSKSSSSRPLKPSLLPLKPQVSKAKKGQHKARDSDVREKLDQASRVELREALQVEAKTPLVKKKEVPVELARGGDPLAQSLDDLSMALGAA